MSISHDRLRQLKDLFDRLDTDGNGSISFHELKVGLKNSGVRCSDEEVRRVMNAVDRDGDGEIQFDEFLRAMTRNRNTDPPRN